MERELDRLLPEPTEVRRRMSALAQEVDSHKIPENLFLFNFVFPIALAYMQSAMAMPHDEARRAILCEYHAKMNVAGNPFRRAGHPFKKSDGLNVDKILQTWRKPKGKLPINQAYPDFALASPFPHKVVFDAKYFTQESQAAAEKALVEGVHEAAFYRGLAAVPPSGPTDPGWCYDFGCLVAYDATVGGFLKATWDSVVNREPFWDGANVFVMVLRGNVDAT